LKKRDPFTCFHGSPEVIQLAVTLYGRFPITRRNMKDLLHQRGINICCETVWYW
jgi:putative transposase